MKDVLTPAWWADDCEECESESQPKAVVKTLVMTRVKLGDILTKAAARAGKKAKAEIAESNKRLAELQTEIAELRAETLRVLENRLVELKQQQ